MATANYTTGSGYAGANSSSMYHCIIKLKTPAFAGVFNKLNISLYIKTQWDASMTLRYALATSDANKAKYAQTTGAVTDEYQLGAGTFTLPSSTSYSTNTIGLRLNGVKPNTEYYLYLWPYNRSCLTQVADSTYHSIEVDYTAQTYIDSVSNVTLGEAVSVKFTPPAASFAYKLKFSIGNWSYTTGVITPKTTAQYTHKETIPLAAANQITGKPPVGTMTVTLYSYLDSTASTQVGTADSKTFTATVPDNSSTKPAVSMTLSLINTLSAPFNTLYIQNLTKVSASISATGKYGASISANQMVIGGSTIGSPYVSGYLTQTGNVAVTAKATDSRGFVGQTQQTIYVIPYGKPTIVPASDETKVVCARCDANGNQNDSGTYLKIKARRSYSPVVSNGTQYNFCQIRYRCNGGSWVTILARDSDSDLIDINIPNVVTSTTTAYTIEVGVIDDLGYTHSVEVIVPSDRVEFNLREGGKGAAFGEYAQEDNVLSVAASWKLKAKGGIDMAGSALTGLPTPTENSHAATKGYVDSTTAPAGYGLGEHGRTITDWNAATTNGFVKEAVGTEAGHSPFIGKGSWGYVTAYSNGAVTQIAFSSVTAGWTPGLSQKIRVNNEGTWLEWEWVNPPMELGVEYRTTQRWNGKPLYTKAIELGTLPNTGSKEISGVVIGGMTGIWGIETVINTPRFGRVSYEPGLDIVVGGDGTYGWVIITTTKNMTGYSGWLILKYTKT